MDLALEKAGVLPELQEPKPKSPLQTQEFQEISKKIGQLKLDNEAVIKMEKARVARWVQVQGRARCKPGAA